MFGRREASLFTSTRSVAALSWIDRIPVPAWITASDRTLLRLNAAAVELFQCKTSDYTGRVCYEVFGGERYIARDVLGRHPFCGPHCPLQASLDRDTCRVAREAARNCGLVVMFFDDVDHLGSRSDHIGSAVDSRVLPSFLHEIDGVEELDGLLPPAMRRTLFRMSRPPRPPGRRPRRLRIDEDARVHIEE